MRDNTKSCRPSLIIDGPSFQGDGCDRSHQPPPLASPVPQPSTRACFNLSPVLLLQTASHQGRVVERDQTRKECLEQYDYLLKQKDSLVRATDSLKSLAGSLQPSTGGHAPSTVADELRSDQDTGTQGLWEFQELQRLFTSLEGIKPCMDQATEFLRHLSDCCQNPGKEAAWNKATPFAKLGQCIDHDRLVFLIERCYYKVTGLLQSLEVYENRKIRLANAQSDNMKNDREKLHQLQQQK